MDPIIVPQKLMALTELDFPIDLLVRLQLQQGGFRMQIATLK